VADSPSYVSANQPWQSPRAYKEEGTTTTPFDIVVRNDMDRFHLVTDVIDRVLRAKGAGEDIGLNGARVRLRGTDSAALMDTSANIADHQVAIRTVFTALENVKLPRPSAVGHRVVHGGPEHVAPERITPALMDALPYLVAFAPLHLPAEIVGIEAVAVRFPDLPQVVCFDTAFHRRMPEVAQRFALPRALWDAGIRRYGFHGLSYEYIVETLRTTTPGCTIIAHLGNGASMAAIRDGQPLDTTMGLAPTGGVMMGTRSGDLDPGILLHLMQKNHYDEHRIQQLVNYEAGLLGVSGSSSDMKTLLETRGHDAAAAQAVEMFCYQVRKQIGALTAVLGGLDTLVFTGGIGERAAPVRWEVCAPLAYLGIQLDPPRNAAHADLISLDHTLCIVRVIPTNEDLMIARHTRALL
jgi:acetate kinase